MAGLYVHIPYCRRRCIYCDFYSVGSMRAPWAGLVNGLLAELHLRLDEIKEPISTIYIGGGTPSQLPTEDLTRLISGIYSELGERIALREFTVEANPEDVTGQLLKSMVNCGVNRLSIGVQSLQDVELKHIGRRHTSNQALEAVKLAKQYIPNVSIDLMFGLPNQTLQSWKNTLQQVIELKVPHISAYTLMREPGTALDIMLRQKRIQTPGDEANAEMYHYLSAALKDCGYTHYEISNYALPGSESQHNQSYWQSVPYIGIGPSAHSYDGHRTRRANLQDVKRYLTANRGEVPHETEILSDTELLEEYVMTRLRTARGIDVHEVVNLLGSSIAEEINSRCRRYINSKGTQLLRQTGRGYALTDHGIMVSDTVISAIGFTD